MAHSTSSDSFSTATRVFVQCQGFTLNTEFIIKSLAGFAVQHNVFAATSAEVLGWVGSAHLPAALQALHPHSKSKGGTASLSAALCADLCN